MNTCYGGGPRANPNMLERRHDGRGYIEVSSAAKHFPPIVSLATTATVIYNSTPVGKPRYAPTLAGHLQ